MKKIRFWHCTLVLGIITIILLCSVAIINCNFNFYLNGDEEYSLLLGEEYKEEGAVAEVFNKDLNKDITIIGNVDTNRVGIYEIEYNIDFMLNKYKINRVINVVDNIKPDIELIGDNEINIYVGEEYVEDGVNVNDNYDASDILDIVIDSNVDVNNVGEYEVVYSVMDSSGNLNTITRRVNVLEREVVEYKTYNYDYNNPVIKYIRDNDYDVSVGYYNLINGNYFYYRENELYYGASLIKSLDAIYLYDNNLVTEELKPYINKTISRSDNEGHSYLVNYIGKDNLKNYGISLGAYNTLSGSDIYGNTTVKDQIIYMKKLYSIVGDNEELKGYFLNDYGNYLNFDGIDVMHKYGYYDIYYHDVGIVLDDNPYIVVVLTREADKDEKYIINNISKLVYDYHKNNL